MKARIIVLIVVVLSLSIWVVISQDAPYYTCPMHPQIKQEGQGNCPICGMKLVLSEEKEHKHNEKQQVQKKEEKKQEVGNKTNERPDEKEQEQTIYTCSMHPEIQLNQPGNCPICGMKLIPMKKEKELIIPQDKLSIYGIKLAKTEKIDATKTINIVGNFEYNEQKICQISAKFNGWIKKLYMNFEGAYIQKNHKLALIYSPELGKLHTELIFYKKDKVYKKNFNNILSHFRHLGLSNREIKRLSNLNKPTYYFWIDSPCEGIITKKHIFDDMYFMEGTNLFEIVDLKNMWFIGRIYESEMHLINLLNIENTLYRCPMHHNIISQEKGVCPIDNCQMPLVPFNTNVTITIKHPLLNNGEYTDYVDLIYPTVEEETRTITFRVNIPNTNLLLRKNMYASAQIKINYKNILAVPETAVVFTGDKNIVFTYENGKITPQAVNLGEKHLEKENNDENNFLIPYKTRYIQILSGLKENETILSSGTFIIDAESQFRKITTEMHNH